MRGDPFLSGLTGRCLGMLWGVGGAAGIFLLLCAAGVVVPETLGPERREEAVPAAVWTRTEPKPLRAAALSPEDLDRASEAAAGKDGEIGRAHV